jgi:uncharacterized protein (TIGR02996 family)
MNEPALLAAVCEAPGDDTPRLIYADWLEDNGDPHRAELIRVQCARAALAPDDARAADLEQRERALLRKHRQRWLAGVPGAPARVEFHRGFPVPRLQADCLGFLARRPADLDPYPLWHFRITGAEHRAEELAAALLLARAGGLNLACNAIGASGALALAQHARLGEVVDLGLRRNWIGTAGLPALLRLDLPRLRSLDLGGNRIDNEGCAVLARAPFLVNVTVLKVEFNSLRDAGAQALADSPLLGRLRELDLSANYVGDAGARAIARSPHLARLEVLRLANQLRSGGARALAESASLQRLQALHLSGNPWLTEADKEILKERFGRHVHFF